MNVLWNKNVKLALLTFLPVLNIELSSQTLQENDKILSF